MVEQDTELTTLASALAGLFFSLEEVYEAASKNAGVSRQQAQLLCATHWRKPALGELAETLRCDKTNVTGLVDRVEKQGLVERVSDSGDRRITRLELTRKGRATVAEFHDNLNTRLSNAAAELDIDPSELSKLASLLRAGVCA